MKDLQTSVQRIGGTSGGREPRGAGAATPRRSAGSPKRRIGEILDAAARVFDRRGYHGSSTQDIADELGIRQATLYYYFRSKDIALEQVCLIGVEGYVERAQAIATGAGSAAEKLRQLIAAHLAPLRERPAYVRVFVSERRHLPDDSRRKVGRVSRRYERIVQDVIEAGVADGAFSGDIPPRLATLAVLGMCNAAIGWWGTEPQIGVDVVTEAFALLTKRGLGAVKEAPRSAVGKRAADQTAAKRGVAKLPPTRKVARSRTSTR